MEEKNIQSQIHFDKFQKYIKSAQSKLETDQSLFISNIEGIETNDVSRKIFKQENLTYSHSQFSELSLAHSVFNTLLENSRVGEMVTFLYPVNFDGNKSVARVYASLLSESWDNPILAGLSEVSTGEHELLEVIERVKKEEDVAQLYS